MELRTIRKKIDGDIFRLAFFGDTHVGTEHCEEDRLQRDVKKISEDPIMSCIIMGDVADFVNISDKRFEPEVLKDRYRIKDLSKLAQVQVADFLSMTQPLRGKTDGFLKGNHEDTILFKYHFDVWEGIKFGLDLKEENYWGYAAVCRYIVESDKNPPLMFEIYVEHGSGGSRTPERALAIIKAKSINFSADIYAMGHHHKKIWDTEPGPMVVDWNKSGSGKIREKRKGSISNGSYLKTYVEGICGYGEKRSYPPVELGSVMVEWNLETQRFDIHNL